MRIRTFSLVQMRRTLWDMRREIFRSPRDAALALLRRAPFVHLAGLDDDGAPVFRTVHGVVVGERLCFHGAPAGEKMAVIGKRVVLQAEEVVAEVPSWFMDPVRACPATTLYESAQVHGVLERIDDIHEKAQVLQALMERYQPEGRHRPITATDPLYANAVKGILILGVSLAALDGKSKLGQNRTPDEVSALVENLWRRGAPGDARAVDLVLGANPAVPVPAFLAAPRGISLRAALDPTFLDAACDLLAGAYWNSDVSREAIARAHRGSSAWVGALDEDDELVATARALADGAKWGTIYDIIVREDWRRRGVGQALVRLLLEHPALRGCTRVGLRTRDAQTLYARFGFEARAASAHTEMLLRRPEPPATPK